jgi:hypothetical protein
VRGQLGGELTRKVNEPLERGSELVLLEVPLALHVAHMLRLQLKLCRGGLPALGTKRRLPCRGPRERDDGREIREGVVKRRTGVVDVAQSETVRHHYDVLPFAGDATQGLFVCGVSATVIVVVWKLRTLRIVITLPSPYASSSRIGLLSSGLGSLD